MSREGPWARLRPGLLRVFSPLQSSGAVRAWLLAPAVSLGTNVAVLGERPEVSRPSLFHGAFSQYFRKA